MLAENKQVEAQENCEPSQKAVFKLAELREEIDNLDEEICELLLKRLAIAESLADLKKELGLAIKDRQREAEVLERTAQKANSKSKSKTLHRLFKVILEESCRIQCEKLD
ncbi:MAG: chorismate mutase [Candidatus Obscuribacterales bacterium]|nr:chorismate mutase [Candidatus Obscuribacterales bacterium]